MSESEREKVMQTRAEESTAYKVWLKSISYTSSLLTHTHYSLCSVCVTWQCLNVSVREQSMNQFIGKQEDQLMR